MTDVVKPEEDIRVDGNQPEPVSHGSQADSAPAFDADADALRRRLAEAERQVEKAASSAAVAERAAARMQAAAEVSHAATSMLSLSELLPTSVELIRERFDLYYVGLFLLDEDNADDAVGDGAPRVAGRRQSVQEAPYAVLRAGTGEAGRQMLAAGHRLQLGSDSMIGQCVATGKPGILDDVSAQKVDQMGRNVPRFANPLLPETKSEMALPLISRNRVLGAMTIQSRLRNAFSDEDITVLQTMANQLANAIQNARLFQQMDDAVRENETLYNVSTLVGEAHSPVELVGAALTVADLMGLSGASLRVFTRWDAAGVPTLMDVYGTGSEQGAARDPYHETDVPFSRELYDWFFRDPRRIFVCRDLANPGDLAVPPALSDPLLERGYRSLLVAPLRTQARNRGVLALFGPAVLDTLPARYVQVLTRTLADQTAAALDRQFLMSELEHRAGYLTAAADVSRLASSSLEEDRLLGESADLLRTRFRLDHVGIFILDESRQSALLRASSAGSAGAPPSEALPSEAPPSEAPAPTQTAWLRSLGVLDRAGAQPRSGGSSGTHRGYRVDVNAPTIIGQCIHDQTPFVDEVSGSVAVPLLNQGQSLGALVLKPDAAERLSEQDTVIFGTLADQLANAIANARLYQESQVNLDALQRLQRRYAMDMWDEYIQRQDIVGYAYEQDAVMPLTTFEQVDLPFDRLADMGPVVNQGIEGGDGASLAQPLQIRGQPVGLISFEEPGEIRDWSEDQVSVLDTVREQLELALENRLLIDRSQRALQEARQRESELGFLQEVSALLNATNDVAGARDDLFNSLREFVPLSMMVLFGLDETGTQRQLIGVVSTDDSQGRDSERADFIAGLYHLRGSGTRSLSEGQGWGSNFVLAQGKSVIQDDLRVNPRFVEDAELVASGIIARALLPLQLGLRTLGVLELCSPEANAFSRPGLGPILQQVASQVASALERGNLLQVAQISADESRRLYEATSSLAEALGADDVLAAIAQHAFPTLEPQPGSPQAKPPQAAIGMYVTDPETRAEREWLEIVATNTSPAVGGVQMAVGARLRVSEVPLLSLLGDQQMYVCPDLANPAADEHLTSLRRAFDARGIRALMAVALSTGVAPGQEAEAEGGSAVSERLGVLMVQFSEPQQFIDQELRLYRTLCDQAAVVLSNRQLYQESQARIVRQSIAVELANLTTSLSERETLLQTSVDFLRDRFGLYFVGIFLMDETTARRSGQAQWAVLEAGTGDIGHRLLAMGYRVQVGAAGLPGGGTMVGQAIQRGQRVMSLDIDPQTAMMENPLLTEMRSAAMFPLVSRGQTNGAVMLLSTRRFAFTQEDLATLELMVNQLANVIESANLYERSQSSLAEIRMLYRIAQQITDAHDVNSVLVAAADGIAQRREPDWVIAGVFEGGADDAGPEQPSRPSRLAQGGGAGDDAGIFRVLVSWSREGQAFPVESVPVRSMRSFYDALRSDERFVTPDATQDPMVGDTLRRIFTDLGLRAAAAFQLRPAAATRTAPFGMILISSRLAREFSMAELSFYENVTRQSYVALENISLVEVTQAQAERRDILNQVLQTASGSLDEETILSEVGEVIAQRLDMPVMIWSCDRSITRTTVEMARALELIGIYDAGGGKLSGDATALTRSIWGEAAGGVPTADNEAAESARPLYRLIHQRVPAEISFGDHRLSGAAQASGAQVPGDGNGRGRRQQLSGLGGWRERFHSPPEEGYAVPLAARDVVYGVIVLGRQAGHPAIDDLEREFLRTASANISVALETASLYRDAQETAKKLQEVDELKNQFMANMSHELRTPLNSIIGFSRVMLRGIDGPLTDMQQTDLNAIYESGRHLLNLINDILDISKINAGKMEVLFEPVDIGAMIESVMSTALGFVKDKNIRLMTDVPEGMPLVTADARRIRQVLTNLLGNAGKFTEEGFIKVSATYDDVQVIVSVQDTGIGIPADRIHAVFEQFEQVDSSSTRRYGGTGLGVPLSREFVRIHGGDMWIQETTVGVGTTFCFSLPIGGPDSITEPRPEDMRSSINKVVLTVDDDEGVITLFRRYLEQKGYRVFGLTNGERVVEEARRLKPYAITLDVIMPGKDGWEIIRDLKSNPETRDIPIIICSILGDKDKGLSMGVADYLVKPISETALLSALERVEDVREGGYVLVVDDNPDDRKLLRRILEDADYEVSEVDGGAAAIEAIHARPPALVVLDLMMPEVDGFAVLEHLKSKAATRQIPVVVVTAKELGTEERARLQQGVEALLQKGLFDQKQLLNDVTTALDRLAPLT